MQHGILGAGGIGGLIGAVLAHAGESVHLVVRPGTETLYPKDISLQSTFGQVTAPVRVESRVDRPLDILWISVKATQLEAALASVPPEAKIDLVVPLLNGIDHVERLRKRFGADRVVPATIAVESERVSPGNIVHRSPFVRFNTDQKGSQRLAIPLKIFQQFGFDCKVLEDEPTLLWSKLVFLAPIALTTSAIEGPIGEVMKEPSRMAGLEQCVREACAVASAAGAKVDVEAVLGTVRGLPAGMRSSMQKDIAKGNPPELDAIAGPILRGGQKYGIAVPKATQLARAVAEIAQQRMNPK